MGNVLGSASIPEDAGIAIEYNIPRTGNRIDFIVSWQNAAGQEHAVLIELKQWDKDIQITDKDAMVRTRFRHGPGPWRRAISLIYSKAPVRL